MALGAELGRPVRPAYEAQFDTPMGDRRNRPDRMADWGNTLACPSPNVVHTEDARMLERVATALDVQVGGAHYKSKGIQPVEYIHANGLDFFEGSAIKYITRWRQKGGVADLDKAIHFLEMLKQLEELS